MDAVRRTFGVCQLSAIDAEPAKMMDFFLSTATFCIETAETESVDSMIQLVDLGRYAERHLRQACP
jgi:hypothetical protein